MTRRPKVWAMHEKRVVEMPEWEIRIPGDVCDGCGYPRAKCGELGVGRKCCPDCDHNVNCRVRAPYAWDAWKQVPGAPAFGSCRVRRVE